MVAYPTEGVFGLGCLPDDANAVLRILGIKDRNVSRGLVLIAADALQLDGWVDMDGGAPEADASTGHPVTWIVPADPRVPAWVRGDHDGIAVRITGHPVAAALCLAADSPLVSTSANVAGRPPARNALVARRLFGRRVDYVVPGRCGTARGASEIRDYASGRIVRPAPR